MDVFQHLATVWDLCNIPNFVNHFHESFFIKWEYLLRVFFQLYASRFKQGNLGMESSKWWNQSENSTKIYRLLKVKALYTFVLSPSYVHSVEKWQSYSNKKKRIRKKRISWNQLFSNFCSENVAFTKFLRNKSVEVNFCNFHTVN